MKRTSKLSLQHFGTLFVAGFLMTCHLTTGLAATYYISQSSGSDAGDGTSPATAWKTLSKASREYTAGDKILLKCGDTWNEELRPLGEGTAMTPITISSYGDGPRPIIDRQDATGKNIDNVCIRLKNIAGYKITDIEFARFGRGVFVDFDKGVHGKEYVWVEDCYFRDALYYNCTGWYTKDIPSDGGTGPNYVFDVGVWVQTRETEDVICLSDITVKKCRFERVACAINVWSGNEWDMHAENLHEFRNVVIDQCTAEGGKNWQFVIHSTIGGRISNSWVHRVAYYNEDVPNGIAGSMLYRSEDIIVENCEFGHISLGADGHDGQSFDLEGNMTRTVFRNCLFHETEGAGFLMVWGASANANTKNVETQFENCVFNAKEKWQKERTESRSSQVFCGQLDGKTTLQNCRFYLAKGEVLPKPELFEFDSCQIFHKDGDLGGSVRLDAKVSASTADYRHPEGQANDEEVKTAWRSDSGTSAGEWLELDFGAPRRVDYLVVDENMFSSVSRFAIQTWDADASLWRDCFNGGTIGPEFLVTIVPVTTRKIRLVVHRTAYGSPGINEIEAYSATTKASRQSSTEKLSNGVFNDTHKQIVYSDWVTYSSVSEIDGDERYTNVKGASCQFTFSGIGITWIGVKNLDAGEADVYIDDAFQATVDTYNSARLSQQALFTETGLAPGKHTIKIVVKGTKNPASKDCYVIVDAFKVHSKND